MHCKISCSFGEIVDKVTILKIKQEKAVDKDQYENITKELTIIEKENPQVTQKDDLFDVLSTVNKKLWELEDNIRDKSRKREFDQTYIDYAEQIHTDNDKRYQVKKQINDKYNSFLTEEKIYKRASLSTIPINETDIVVEANDMRRLEICKQLYSSGNYDDSMTGIQKLIRKYQNYSKYDAFFVDLMFSYSIICSIFDTENEYEYKIYDIMDFLSTLNIPDVQKDFCRSQFTTLCLGRKDYLHKNTTLSCINSITGPNISHKNMSFFKENDTNKTLLIYDGGGIGDKFMFGRLVFLLIKNYITTQNNNKIIFIVQDPILWFMREILKEYNTITFISSRQLFLVGKYDYHCNLLSLVKYLNISYDTLPATFVPFNDKLNVEITDRCNSVLSTIQPNTYILNWKGNPENPHEKHNRMMNLINAIPLLKINKPIHWLVLAKSITQQEKKLLKKYNASWVGDKIDKDKAFYDTITILGHKNISGVISTDTSLPHISLSLGIKTYVLLTTGCEWRWTHDEKTNWYPDAILVRQQKHGDWSHPIQQLATML